MSSEIRENFYKNLEHLREFNDTAGVATKVASGAAKKWAKRGAAALIPGGSVVAAGMTAYDTASGAIKGYKKGGILGAAKGAVKGFAGLDDEPETATPTETKNLPLAKTRKLKIKPKAKTSALSRAANWMKNNKKKVIGGGAAAAAAAGAAKLAGGEDESKTDPVGSVDTKALTPSEFGMKVGVSAPGRSTPDVTSSELLANYNRATWKQPASVRESTIKTLKAIVENKIPSHELQFGDNTVTINNRVAKKVINVYESLNKENKKKIEQMLNEDIVSFRKVINFAIRQ